MINARRPGRPRDPAVDEAIEAAAWQVLVKQGPRRLSPERVADEAGVAASTVYRRFDTGDDLVVALARRLVDSLTVPDTGTLRGDLIELMHDLSVVLSPPGPRRALVALLSAVEDDPDLATMRDLTMDERRRAIDPLVKRAVGRGELSADTDPVLVAEMLTAFVGFRILFHEGLLHDDLIASAVDLMLAGVLQRP